MSTNPTTVDSFHPAEKPPADPAHTEELSRLRMISQHTTQMIVVSTPDNRIEWVNEAVTTHTGVTFADAVGRAPSDVLPVVAGSGIQAEIDQTLASGSGFVGEIPYRIHGEIRWFHVELQPVHRDGSVAFFVGFNRDITDTVRRTAEEEHGHRLEAIGSLAAGVAHEINTPVQFVSDNVAFLQESFSEITTLLTQVLDTLGGEGDASDMQERIEAADLEFLVDEIPRAIEQSNEGLQRVSAIVTAMKDFARTGGGHFDTDLNKAIASTVDVTRGEWNYVADLELDLDENVGTVVCNEGEIKQTLLNLITNAVHAIEETGSTDGHIAVSSRRDGTDVVVKISDSGCGMTDEVKARMFDAFFTTRDVGKGSGQGLSMARSIICQGHGGSIDVTSKPGEGTTVAVRLPVAGPSAD